ncbi:hypothetical protein BJ742DRAFT_835038 [Cladochytrium replicatum]|nr:hypothetical protein BJ742DRAFT_835038 [Cladochytrium replicatum]
MGNQLKGLARSSSPSPSTSDPNALPRPFHPLKEHQVVDAARMNMQRQYLVKHLCNSNFAGVPARMLTSGTKVLHAGATTAAWLLEMENEFPASTYFAVSFSMHLWPDRHRIKASVNMDIRESLSLADLVYEDRKFDYVHENSHFSITPIALWPQGIKELARVLKPGGYLDIVEMEPFPAFAPTPLISGYVSRLLPIVRAGGIDLLSLAKISEMLKATGSFTDVKVENLRADLGWEAEMGGLWRMHLKEAHLGLREVAGMAVAGGTAVPSFEDFSNFLDTFFEDCAKWNAYCNVYRVTARKRL